MVLAATRPRETAGVGAELRECGEARAAGAGCRFARIVEASVSDMGAVAADASRTAGGEGDLRPHQG